MELLSFRVYTSTFSSNYSTHTSLVSIHFLQKINVFLEELLSHNTIEDGTMATDESKV